MKNLTLHKRNEMVRGGDNYSLYAKRALNAIYYAIQYALNNGNNEILKAQYVTIDFPYLRKMMGLEKVESYVTEIEKALIELQQPIQLNNFKDPRTNEILNWVSFPFISYADWALRGNKKVARIEFPVIIKYLIENSSIENFTKLEIIPYLNKMRTKYSMKLYEYLVSFKEFRYIDISQQHMLKLFGLEDKKTYKNYANLFQLIKRQINEITTKTDLKNIKLIDNKVLRKEKKFRIIINPKAKNKVDDLMAKNKLNDLTNKLIHRF